MAEYEKPINRFIADLARIMTTREKVETPAQARLPCRTKAGIEFRFPDKCYVVDKDKWEPLRQGLIDDGDALLLVELDAGAKIAALFDCKERLLSNAINNVRLADGLRPDGCVSDQVNGLLNDPEKKARVLALIDHSTSGKTEKVREWKPNVKAVADLRVIPELDGRVLEPVPLFFHWEDEDDVLWIDVDNHWTNLAKGICQRFNLKNNLDDALDNLFGKLNSSLEEAKSYLRGKQIDENEIEHWLDEPEAPTSPQIPPAIPSEEMPEDEQPSVRNEQEEIEEEAIAPANGQGTDGPVSEVGLGSDGDDGSGGSVRLITGTGGVNSGRTGGGSGGGSGGGTRRRPHGGTGGGTGGQAGREQGEKAEKWLLGRLKERLPERDGWTYELRVRDEEQRETDILLNHREYGEFHVEVKSMKGQVIYWSRNEIAKAKDHPGKYFMAVLLEQQDDDYEENWLTDPLEQLREEGDVKGVWLWDSREDADVAGNWQMPDKKPEKEPNNHSFRITMERERLEKISVGFEELFHGIVSPEFSA